MIPNLKHKKIENYIDLCFELYIVLLYALCIQHLNINYYLFLVELYSNWFVNLIPYLH